MLRNRLQYWLRAFLALGMLGAVIIAVVIGVILSLPIFFQGVDGITLDVLVKLEELLVYIIAFGITTEAYLNGGHYAREEWTTLWRRLVLYLTVALFMRGAAVYIASYLVGVEERLQVATGLTATDPAAVGVSLNLTGAEHGVRTALSSYNWLATIESQMNDGEGLVLFELARHTSAFHIGEVLLHTVFFAFLIAATDAWTRWAIRNVNFGGRLAFVRNHEPYAETGSVAAIYVVGFYLGNYSGISPILTAAIAAVLANWWMHRLPRERAYEAHEKVRRQLNDLWSQIGLGAVIVVAVAVMPYQAFINEPFLFIKAAVILAAIAISRLLFEVIGVFYGRDRKFPWGSSLIGLVSVGTSSCLLGVPTVVGIALAAHGDQQDAHIVFATIFLSWLTVLPTVKFMQWADARLTPQKHTIH